MSKIRCFKCDGRGQTGVEVNDLFVVLSLGLGALADTSQRCDACNGKGYIEEKEES